MDKTGTLTKGVFEVTKIETINDFSEDELIEYAAYTESHSSHPIATSILKAYGNEIDSKEISNYNEISGHGIKTTVKGKEVLAGNIKLINVGGSICRCRSNNNCRS